MRAALIASGRIPSKLTMSTRSAIGLCASIVGVGVTVGVTVGAMIKAGAGGGIKSVAVGMGAAAALVNAEFAGAADVESQNSGTVVYPCKKIKAITKTKLKLESRFMASLRCVLDVVLSLTLPQIFFQKSVYA